MNDAQEPHVAVLGVGTMGTGMAHSLERAGFAPAVWDRNPQRVDAFANTRARPAGSVRDALSDADVVITMVTDANAVVSIAEEQGMLDAMKPGATWAQMSTIGVEGFDRVAALVEQKRPDIMLVDAPVTGSKDVAEGGSLTIFASGPSEARSTMTPVFDALGQRTLWLGPAGLGTRLKLANNTMIAFVVQGLAEALSVAHHLDLTTEAVTEAFKNASFESPYLTHKLARIEQGQYEAEFSLALALKDVKLALDAVDPARHPVLDALASQWQQAADQGLGSKDLTAIAHLVDAG